MLDPISRIPLHTIARALPIYPFHGSFADAPPRTRHHISDSAQLPPPQLPGSILPHTFMVRTDPVETSVLEIALSVPTPSLAATFTDHILPRVAQFPPAAQLAASQSLLLHYSSLTKEKPSIADDVRAFEFIPDTNGTLRKAADLHDPRTPGLRGVLTRVAPFPAKQL